jgi:hypothetical protein
MSRMYLNWKLDWLSGSCHDPLLGYIDISRLIEAEQRYSLLRFWVFFAPESGDPLSQAEDCVSSNYALTACGDSGPHILIVYEYF